MLRREVLISAALALVAALMPLPALAANNAAPANVPWYLSRAFGLIAYLLLFVTVALGIAIHTRGLDRLLARWRVNDLHTFLSVLTALFVVVHVVALLGDAFVGYSAIQLLVPFSAAARSFWTGIGQLTAYLLLIVLVSFPLRRFTGYRFWRTLHYLTFVVYLGALLHGLFTGTDSAAGWAQVLYAVTALALVALIGVRMAHWGRREVDAIVAGRRDDWPEMTSLPTDAAIAVQREAALMRAATFVFAAALVVLVVFGAAAAGPFHWLGSGGAQASAGAVRPSQPPPAAYQQSFTGTVGQTLTGRTQSVRILLLGTGAPQSKLEIDLQLSADGEVLADTAQLTDASGAPICQGSADSVDELGFSVSCEENGQPMTINGTFDGGLAARVQGQFTVQPASR